MSLRACALSISSGSWASLVLPSSVPAGLLLPVPLQSCCMASPVLMPSLASSRSKRSCRCCQLSSAEVPMSAGFGSTMSRSSSTSWASFISPSRLKSLWLCTHACHGAGAGESTLRRQSFTSSCSRLRPLSRRRSWGSSPSSVPLSWIRRWMKPWMVVIGARSMRSIASSRFSSTSTPCADAAQRLISSSKVGSLAGLLSLASR